MAKANRPNMSCARVKQYKASDVGQIERHNERKNESYENVNVVPERIPYNIHFRSPGNKTYLDILKEMEDEGKVSTRGLRDSATLFDEIIIDVNTRYFEEHGGYEYAKEFFGVAYNFIKEKFGEENVVSAVMHADEINKALTDEMGTDVYHYHLHAVVMPVVEKKILWSKRCKDEELRGTVKEVINQISHSKKWASNIPMLDENNQPVLKDNGKPKFRASYSVLQDEIFNYMQENGYRDFQRGELGSTAENLTCLQYQIEKDKERLSDIQEKINEKNVEYKSTKNIFAMYSEIDSMGKRTFTGKISLEIDEYSKLTTLAKEGISSRAEIKKLKDENKDYKAKYMDNIISISHLKGECREVKEKCKPYLVALDKYPDVADKFAEKINTLSLLDEIQRKTEKEKKNYIYIDNKFDKKY